MSDRALTCTHPETLKLVPMKKPNFFIVGAPRCCTGSLWTYLKGHPDIFMPEKKELSFFNSDLWGTTERSPTLEGYLEHFSGVAHQIKIGEATPDYLRSRVAPAKIKAFCPEAQIIIMLRNPPDLMYSLYKMMLYDPEPLLDFEAALEADAARTGRRLIGYWEFTDFPSQVERYFKLFGRENVHTMIYDDLKANPGAVCQQVLRFLGVRTDYAAEFPWIHKNKEFRNERLGTMLADPPPYLRNLGHALVPRSLRSKIRQRLIKLNLVVRARPPMDPALRRRVQKIFEPKIEQLSELLGRDLSAWCKDSPTGASSVARTPARG